MRRRMRAGTALYAHSLAHSGNMPSWQIMSASLHPPSLGSFRTTSPPRSERGCLECECSCRCRVTQNNHSTRDQTSPYEYLVCERSNRRAEEEEDTQRRSSHGGQDKSLVPRIHAEVALSQRRLRGCSQDTPAWGRRTRGCPRRRAPRAPPGSTGAACDSTAQSCPYRR
jgi:hypothetical protein